MARTKKSTPTAPAPADAAPVAADTPITLTGRLCADPVLRRTQSGIAVTNLRLAVNPPEGDATFHSVVAWKRTAEVVAQYLKKGRLVEVVGFPRDRTWTDKEGAVRTSTEISAVRVQFLASQPSVEREVGA